MRNSKKKIIKENKTNVEKINDKKGFYHYQNNPTKEVKSIVDKKFEIRTRNAGVLGYNQANTYMENYNSNNNGNLLRNSMKKRNINKQNSNNSRLNTFSNLNEKKNSNEIKDKDMLVMKMNKGRNKKNIKLQNNTIAYNNDINLPKVDADENELNKSKNKVNNKKNIVLKVKNNNKKLSKKSSKKLNDEKNKVVQNLIDDFDQTMEEYSSLYNTHNPSSKGKKSIKTKNDSNNPLRRSVNNRNIKNRINTSTEANKKNNHSVLLNGYGNNLNQSHTKEEKIDNKNTDGKKAKNRIIKENNKKSKNKKSDKDISEFDAGSSAMTNGNIIKIKKSKTNMKYSDKDGLPLFRGEIDYNNVSIKSLDDTIEELLNKYKKKGYTCVKKGNTEFKFVKGPNVHHVEIMRLGNGLLYFNVIK